MTPFDRVKKLADKQKITIVELEEKVGFSRNSLYSWKKNNPSSEKLDNVDTRVTELEENAPLSPGDYGHISRLVNQRVSTVISERHLKLTQKQRSQLYKDLNAEIKAVMRVPSRTQLRQRHYNDTIDFILNWQPSSATIAIVNQLSIEEFTDIA